MDKQLQKVMRIYHKQLNPEMDYFSYVEEFCVKNNMGILYMVTVNDLKDVIRQYNCKTCDYKIRIKLGGKKAELLKRVQMIRKIRPVKKKDEKCEECEMKEKNKIVKKVEKKVEGDKENKIDDHKEYENTFNTFIRKLKTRKQLVNMTKIQNTKNGYDYIFKYPKGHKLRNEINVLQRLDLGVDLKYNHQFVHKKVGLKLIKVGIYRLEYPELSYSGSRINDRILLVPKTD